MIAIPVPLFYCPTRRAAQAYPMGAREYPNLEEPERSAKSDYAGNIGDHFFVGRGTDKGPLTLEAAAAYQWAFSGDERIQKIRLLVDPKFKGLTGVIFQRSEIPIKQITDGTSKTYLIGEKNVPANHYDDGVPENDDQSMYNGHDKDNLRSTFVWYPGFENSGAPKIPPIPDSDTMMVGNTQPPDDKQWAFGGPHPGGWMALFCDGSVRFLDFDMNPTVHQNYGNRRDGNVID